MLVSTFLDLVFELSKQTVPIEFLERQLMLQIANFAWMRQYPMGLLHATWFYQKTFTMSHISQGYLKPTDSQKIQAVMLTGHDASNVAITKQATKVDLMQDVTVQNNQFQSGTISNPKYREDKGLILVYPPLDGQGATWGGKIHYLRNFGYIDDETFELTDPNVNALPIIPWWLLQDAVNDAVKQVKLRARNFQDVPSAIAKMQAEIKATMDAIRASDDPMAIYGLTLPGTLS